MEKVITNNSTPQQQHILNSLLIKQIHQNNYVLSNIIQKYLLSPLLASPLLYRPGTRGSNDDSAFADPNVPNNQFKSSDVFINRWLSVNWKIQKSRIICSFKIKTILLLFIFSVHCVSKIYIRGDIHL